MPELFCVYALVYLTCRVLAHFHFQRKYTVSKETSNNFWPKVSILIPAHNEGPLIIRTVNNILALNYPNYEVIVIDDRSTDETVKLLAANQSSFGENFQFFSRPETALPGKAAVLNDAMPIATGGILAVLDADARIEPDFLNRLVPYFTEQAVGAVQARKTLQNRNQNILTSCQHYEYLMDASLQVSRDKTRGAVELRGSGMLLRREVITTLGGWNDASITEDLDMSTRMHMVGWDIRYIADTLIYEEALQEIKPLFKQRLRWTKGSLARYLENALTMHSNKCLAFRTKFDMLQFVFECIAPVWLLMENTLYLVKILTHTTVKPPVFYSAPALLILSFYFTWLTFQGIRRFDNGSILEALKGTVLTYVYLSFIWLPLILVILFQMITEKDKRFHWEKTPRYGVALK